MREIGHLAGIQHRLAAKARIYQRWLRIQEDYDQIVVYGAGKYSRKLIATIQSESLRLPALIWDDDPKTDNLDGIPVIKTPEKFDGKVEVVVLGTDSFQANMRRKLAGIPGKKPRIVDVSGTTFGQRSAYAWATFRRRLLAFLIRWISPSGNILLDQMIEARRDPRMRHQLGLLYHTMRISACENHIEDASSPNSRRPLADVEGTAIKKNVIPPAFKPRILDLGCGTAKVQGAIGVDKSLLPDVDVLADASRYPLPFADDSFDVVCLNDVIEHLPDTIAAMEEIWRILMPGGILKVRVVNWNSQYTAEDPTHVKAFTERSFDFFGKREDRKYYSKARFDIDRIDYGYNRAVARILRSERLMHFLGRYLCNVLEDMTFTMLAVKDSVTTPSQEAFKLNDILRCPECISDTRLGAIEAGLLRTEGDWLICQTPTCGTKYRIVNGRPSFLNADRQAKP